MKTVCSIDSVKILLWGFPKCVMLRYILCRAFRSQSVPLTFRNLLIYVRDDYKLNKQLQFETMQRISSMTKLHNSILSSHLPFFRCTKTKRRLHVVSTQISLDCCFLNLYKTKRDTNIFLTQYTVIQKNDFSFKDYIVFPKIKLLSVNKQ